MPYMDYEFPHSNLYNADLRELVSLYKQLLDIYNGLQKEIQDTIDFVNNFEEHADELIREQIAETMSLYLQRLLRVEELVAQLEEEINKDDGILGMVQGLQADVRDLQLQINNLQHMLNDKIFKLEELMHKYKYEISDYVDSQTALLEQYIKEQVTKVDRLDVINPLTGLFEPIQKVLDEMADVITRSYGLTAQQYDSLKLTARVYDGYLITAYDYTTKGYFELWLKLTYDLMRSPFTGKVERFETVIYRLADLHKCGMTAQEYDNRKFTAEQYDSFEVTAYIYDWLGYAVVRKITAGLYDSLLLTATAYDSKQIVAREYDRWAYPLFDNLLSGCLSKAPCGDYQILAQQIADLATKVSRVTSARAGTTFVMETPQGETVTRLTTPNVYDDSFVEIESEKKPIMIVVQPHEYVEVTWDDMATANAPLAFNVTIQNKN